MADPGGPRPAGRSRAGAASSGGWGRRLGALLAAGWLLGSGLFARAGASESTPPGGSPELSWRAGSSRDTLTVAADSLRLSLAHPWVQPTSFRLLEGERELARGLDFLLDPRRGSVRLLRSVAPGTRLVAAYRFFPVPVRAEHRRRALRAAGEQAEEPRAETPARSRRTEGEEAMRLDLTGSKTLSLEVGSRRDAALRQSFDLALDGRVGRDLKIRAVLTDRQRPLESDGGSARLSDLDRILVEAESPNARLTLGDLRLTAPPGEFLRYDRRLQGVRLEATPRMATAFATAATAPGSYVTREFLGQEGKQGPYALAAGTTGESGGIVSASERVILDGQSLTRGETEDYILDYGAGTLTFTGRHPITAYSEITVEYQLVTERYRRSVYGAGAATTAPAGGEAAVRCSFVSEGDDRAHPILPLTEAQRRALRASGDSLTAELSSGIVYLGPGRGEYDLVRNDTLAVSFYLYRGADGGSYQVRFEEVGDGKGDYRDTTEAGGTRFYVYSGRRKGSFLPGIAVPRPERTTVTALSLAPNLGTRLRLRAEAALSDHDPNTFSTRDDEDNVGGAFRFEPSAGPFPLGPVRLELHGSWRSVERRFRSLDRINLPFDAKGWSVAAERLAGGDRRRLLGVTIRRGDDRLVVTAEDLDNRRDFRGKRGSGEAQGRILGLAWSGRITRVRNEDRESGTIVEGRRRTDQAGLQWPGSWVRVGVDYAHERDERGRGDSRTGGFFRERGWRLGTGSRLPRLTSEVSWTRRVRFALEGARETRLDTGDTGLWTTRWTRPGGRSLEAEVAHRELRPEGAGARQRTRLGRLRWTERRGNEAFVQEGRFELSTTDRADRQKEVRFVGAGLGHYDSLGVYAGIGDYDIFYLELGDSLRVNRIDFSLRNELDLGRLGAGAGASTDSARGSGPALRRAARTLRLTATWTAATESAHDASWYAARLAPVLAGMRHLPLVEVSMRTEASVLPAARWCAPRVRWERRRSERAYQAGRAETSGSGLWALRLRSRPAERWTVETLAEQDRTEQEVRVAGHGVGVDGWRSWRGAMEQSVQFFGRLAGGLDLSMRSRHRLGSGESARVLEGTPSLVWSPQAHNRLELRWTRTSVARRDARVGAGRLLETPGGDGRLIGTVRLREQLDLSIWFRDRRPDHAASVQDGRMELRASF